MTDKELIRRYEHVFFKIVVICGEEMDSDKWRAMVFPARDEAALEAVMQLRDDYNEALKGISL